MTEYVEHEGIKRSVRQWALQSGVNYHTFRSRLESGMDFAKAIVPDDKRRVRRKTGPNYRVYRKREPLNVALASWIAGKTNQEPRHVP